jgi:signal transduction histidine kinase
MFFPPAEGFHRVVPTLVQRYARVESDAMDTLDRGAAHAAGAAESPLPLDLIVVEDSATDYKLLLLRLGTQGWTPRAVRVETADELRSALAERACAAVISDHQLPTFSSLEALEVVRAFDPYLPFLVVSGTIGQEVAVAVMRAGADDYIMKDDLARLTPSLRRALSVAASRRGERAAEAALVESEARFRALAANLPGIVFQLQIDAGRIALTYVNEGSRRLLGISPGAILANPSLLLDLVAPSTQAEMASLLTDSLVDSTHVGWIRRVTTPPEIATEWIDVAARARTLPSGATIWDCVAYDITPRKRAEQEMLESREELRELATHLTRVREQERESIAREIHDDVGSTLSALKFALAWMKSQVRESAPVNAKLKQMDQLVDSAIHSSTRIMHDLRPGILDEGIVASLEWQARSFEQRMDVPCMFTSSHEDIPLDRDSAVALFRICQEALNNVAKHANASAVDIRLKATDARIDLEVRDDGVGVATTDVGKSGRFGLRGMRERALSLGGNLHVGDEAPRGTLISVWLPRLAARDGDQGAPGASP